MKPLAHPSGKPGELIQLRSESGVSDISDEGLVAACAAGDRASRALLFERHVAAVHRFIARMRSSDHDAVDDLVQNTFVTAFAAAGTYRGGNVRGWLYGIAANLVRTYARGQIRRKRALESAAELSADRQYDAGDLALAARLPAAIAALPDDQRAVLVLVDLEGERGSDAAAALAIPEGTLWRRLFFARKALRAALGGTR